MKSFKNSAQKYGYYFGLVILYISLFIFIMSPFILVNTDNEINKGGIVAFILSIFGLIYGDWRTFSRKEDEEDDRESN